MATDVNVMKPLSSLLGENIVKLPPEQGLPDESIIDIASKLKFIQWKGINHKQSTRWQHLSRLKASALLSLQKNCCYET